LVTRLAPGRRFHIFIRLFLTRRFQVQVIYGRLFTRLSTRHKSKVNSGKWTYETDNTVDYKVRKSIGTEMEHRSLMSYMHGRDSIKSYTFKPRIYELYARQLLCLYAFSICATVGYANLSPAFPTRTIIHASRPVYGPHAAKTPLIMVICHERDPFHRLGDLEVAKITGIPPSACII
jgi:hypothetical protein